MKRYLVDTDLFSLFLLRHPEVVVSVERHEMDSVSTSIITVEEMWHGWMAAISKSKTAEHLARVYQRFTNTINELKHWRIESFPTAAIERFHSLKKQKLNIGANDLKIAAIALEVGAIVATRNLRDFQRVPGLVSEDWSKAIG